jgi:hypothetical protein
MKYLQKGKVTINGAVTREETGEDVCYSVKFTGELYPPSGDGFNEPRDPGGCEFIEAKVDGVEGPGKLKAGDNIELTEEEIGEFFVDCLEYHHDMWEACLEDYHEAKMEARREG